LRSEKNTANSCLTPTETQIFITSLAAELKQSLHCLAYQKVETRCHTVFFNPTSLRFAQGAWKKNTQKMVVEWWFNGDLPWYNLQSVKKSSA